MEFKVGDIIVAKPDNGYRWTSTANKFVGKVLKLNPGHAKDIEVEVIEGDKYKGRTYNVASKKFLLKQAKETDNYDIY